MTSIETLLSAAANVTILLGAILTVFKFLMPLQKKFNSISDRLEKFFRDWDGTPEEPGRDAIPGVMERLNKLDGELSRNGGKSVKDTVNRIEKRLAEGDGKFDELGKRITEIESSLPPKRKDVA